MPEEIANAAPAEASAPADGDGGAVDTGAAGSAPDFPSADEFGWDTWDGTHDAIPEQLRPWAQKFEGHYTKEARLAREEAERNRSLYEAMMEGREDPRISEYKTKWETEAQTLQRHKQEFETQKSQYDAYRQRVEQHFEQEAEQEVLAWEAANSWILDGGPVQEAAKELITEGFDYEELPAILVMPTGMQEVARKQMKELSASGAKNAGKLAIRLAKAEFQLDEPSPAVALVNGTKPPVSARVSDGPPGRDSSLQEQTQHFVRLALAKR